MMCIKCGMNRRGVENYFVCGDCKKFSIIVDETFHDIENKLADRKTIDPENDPIFRLLADSSFITAQNPQTRIYYSICSLLIEKALDGENEVLEDEINKKVRTTRGWSDIFKVLSDLDLVEVKIREYNRVLFFKPKLKKFALQYRTGEPLTKQLTTRLAHIYTGYILLYLLKLLSQISDANEIVNLPYRQRPKTLWTIQMYLWNKAYDHEGDFSEEEMRKFISRRGIPSTTRGQIMHALQSIDGKTVQSLIKDITFNDSNRIYKFDDYVTNEFERLRNIIRERER